MHGATIKIKKNGIGSLVGKYEEKKPLQRPGCRWKDNNKSHFGEIIFVNVVWIHVMADS
jgi:hypothetical protein